MKNVIFLTQHGLHNAGEIASFVEAQAARLVAAGIALFHHEPDGTAESAPEPDALAAAVAAEAKARAEADAAISGEAGDGGVDDHDPAPKNPPQAPGAEIAADAPAGAQEPPGANPEPPSPPETPPAT